MPSVSVQSAVSAKRRLPGLVYVLTIGTFLMGTSEFVVAGLLPEVARSFTIPVSAAGASITVFAIGMIIGAPAMALATLRLPRRTTLALALVVFAVGHVVGALTASYGVLLGARFVTAVATGAFWAVASVVAAQAAGPAFAGRALGVVLGGGMLANVLGVPLGTLAGQLVGWRGTFWGLATLAAAASVAMIRLMPTEPANRAAASLRAEFRSLASVRLWLILATCAAITGGVLSTYSFVAPILTERAGGPETLIPVLLMLFGGAAVVGNLIGGRLGDINPYRTILGTAALTLVTAVGLLLFGTSVAALMVLITMLGLVGFSANPILVNLALRTGGNAPALATAMPTSIFNLGTAIGTAVSAWALDTRLGPAGPLTVGVIGAAITLVPLTALIVLNRSSARPSDQPTTTAIPAAPAPSLIPREKYPCSSS